MRIRPNLARSSFLVVAFTISVTLFLFRPAQAGPNQGGVIIAHSVPSIVYTEGVESCEFFELDRCADAITEIPTSGETTIWFVTAAFPETSSPRLSAAAFSIVWDPTPPTLVDHGSCGVLELLSGDWPGSHSGIAIVLDGTQTSLVTPLYWFAGYEYYGVPTLFEVGSEPEEPLFADDDLPSNLDEPIALGSLGFSGAQGHLPCPDTGEPGACCLDTCECLFIAEQSCLELGGTWEAGADCSPGACDCPPSACCLPNGGCQVLTETECLDIHGTFVFGEDCDPSPCPEPQLGACCLFDLGCVEITEGECLEQDGIFYNDPCSQVECPEPCDPLAVQYPAPQSGHRGPNANGVLLLHAEPGLQYSSGQLDYCDLTSVTACNDILTRTDSDLVSILSVFAAFPEGSSPSVQFLHFGIHYPTCFEIVDAGGCGESFLPLEDWPQSGTGVAIGFATPRTETFFEVGWIATFVDGPFSGEFGLGTYPSSTGSPVGLFGDENGTTDAIVDFGRVGFRTEGYAPCPPPTVACCFSDGSCQTLPAPDCEAAGGTPMPEAPGCDPNPCHPVPVRDSSWGEVKSLFR